MKRFSIMLAALLVLASAVAAQAQVKPVVYAGGGISTPMAPDFFSDYWGMGYNVGGGLGIQINPSIEVTGSVFFNSFPLDDEKLIEDAGASGEGVTVDGLDFQSLEFGIDLKYILMASNPDAKFLPYLTVGAGMSNVKFTDVTVTGGDDSITLPAGDMSETDFALNGGAGFNYMFSPKAGIWVEGRYTVVMTEGDSMQYIPVRAGVKLLFGE